MKLAIASLLSIVAFAAVFLKTAPNTNAPDIMPSTSQSIDSFKMLKDVGEAYMDHFGLRDEDFNQIKQAEISVIESDFDICAKDEDVQYFLDEAQKYELKVIMPAGAGEAEWGYECGKKDFPKDQRPVWQKDKVQAFINKWKNHPAVFAWDSSNEAGSVMPNASYYNEKNGNVPAELYLNESQLHTAYADIKSVDSDHPIMIRMNGWFFYDFDDNFFRAGNPFAKDVADIVMINAYSNVEDYYDDFVKKVANRAISAITAIDPDTKFVISIGVWEEKPLWYLPSVDQLNTDIEQIQESVETSVDLAFFKYGAKGSEWYLPESAPELWKKISSY